MKDKMTNIIFVPVGFPSSWNLEERLPLRLFTEAGYNLVNWQSDDVKELEGPQLVYVESVFDTPEFKGPVEDILEKIESSNQGSFYVFNSTNELGLRYKAQRALFKTCRKFTDLEQIEMINTPTYSTLLGQEVIFPDEIIIGEDRPQLTPSGRAKTMDYLVQQAVEFFDKYQARGE